MPFLFVEFGTSLQSVLRIFMQLHHLKKGNMMRKRGKKGKGVEKTIILSVIFQYIHFCVSDNYSSKNIGPEQKEKGNTFAFCLLNDSQTLMYMNPSTLE